ncbi:hypothetical protein CIRG_02920 [Coccidioides immitis RMSCC 2394]|uniref:Uncharacterized protein n=1 Tax=Coccidioides immitis RMSCC 2394 TaxID=404692 RepID=A0A0J6Y8W9_COCIT|nr:hypothetical protein CIRG_02920 [Coccidioides immitis RMSCC 2394]
MTVEFSTPLTRKGGIVLLDILMVVCDAGFGLDESTSRESPSDQAMQLWWKKGRKKRQSGRCVAAGTINDPVAMMPLARPRSGSQATILQIRTRFRCQLVIPGPESVPSRSAVVANNGPPSMSWWILLVERCMSDWPYHRQAF